MLGKRAADVAGGDAKRARKEEEEDVGVDVLKVGRMPPLSYSCKAKVVQILQSTANTYTESTVILLAAVGCRTRA